MRVGMAVIAALYILMVFAFGKIAKLEDEDMERMLEEYDE